MHEITLLQGLSLAALVFVLGIDFWLEALFLFRPIIVCTLTGAILGDIQTGLITGGLTELAFAGLTPAGGVQPPNPIMAGICSSFASQGNLLGPILFFAVYLLIFFLRVGWTHVGYSVGVKAIDKVRENSQMIARSATILGITVIGGLIASYVHINVVTSFAIDSTHSVALQQDFFDKVFPNILPMAYTLLMYYFLRVKKAHPVLLIGVTFVLSIVCSAFGIL
ncbi:PTS system mannose/fructose/sorbose family transporter subunit IID [Escherichia coli]|uniref:PTS system mannose/fructose/sorbose family transporter subunit IID n=1 Tax=Escherichia coli TaxID=562 RepID=UPI00193AB29C|nr:PTS system mannose/fructose/sorbose family transporter subunit IID [Escherichia coli]